jgi:hypothetical protein
MKTTINWKKPWLFPLILVFLYCVIYAPNLTRLGFYWDDWQVVFLSLIGSPAEYWNYFLADRPFSIWTYLLTVPIFGMSPFLWQIFTLAMRIAAAWFFSAGLAIIWTDRKWEARWTAVLILVFPGFSQTTISVAYSQHFIAQLLYFASIWLMLKAVTRGNSIWMTSLACLMSVAHMLTLEYFAALELIRPVLLFFLLQNTERMPIKYTVTKTLKAWLPYLVPVFLFAVWRFGYYPRLSSENSVTLLGSFITEPGSALKQFIQFALQDTFSTSFSVWMDAFKPSTLDYRTVVNLLAAAFGAAIIGLYFSKTKDEQITSGDRFVSQSAIVALLFLLLGGLPVWSTNRQALVGLWSDRFTLAPMAGSALLMVTVIVWITENKFRQTIVLSCFIAMAMYAQMLTVTKYTDNWTIQRDYYWQLKWRIPDLKPNTAIVAPKLPTSYISDYAVGFALNAMYAKEPVTKRAQYWFFTGPRAEGDYFASYLPGLPVKYTLRDVTFEGTTDELVGVSYSSGRDCLRVLDSFYLSAPPRLSDNLGGIEKDIHLISNTNRILPVSNSSVLHEDIFGSEPEHNWCYYYQKADLARQFSQWDEIPRLAAEAENAGYRSKVGMEYLPFIEGYAQTGEWESALKSSLTANTLTFGMQPVLCTIWERYAESNTTKEFFDAAKEFNNQITCAESK